MEEIIKLPPVRCKLEEGAKGEVKASVSIDGDSETDVIPRLIKAFKELREGVNART